MNTIILTKSDLEKIINIEDCFRCAGDAYRIYSSRNLVQPPIVSFEIPAHNGELDIKSGYNITDDIIGIKVASGYPDNPNKYGLDSMYAMMLLIDAKTSCPLCIMDAGMVPYYRTAAAGAFAASLLARKESSAMAIIGTGGLARMHVAAACAFFDLKKVYVYGNIPAQQKEFISDMANQLPKVEFISCRTAQDAVADADIIATATPSKEAIIMKEWLKPGVHINAFGCDTKGKQELDPAIFAGARVFVDSMDEATRRGECQHPLAQNIITKDEIAGELGEIVLGRKTGRESDEQITIFDAVGLSIQDIAAAKGIYQKALELKLGTAIDLSK